MATTIPLKNDQGSNPWAFRKWRFVQFQVFFKYSLRLELEANSDGNGRQTSVKLWPRTFNQNFLKNILT